MNTERATIMFYSIYVSFGPRVLVYSSAMSGISESIIESAELDGVNTWQELVHIVLPSIWSTFVTFMRRYIYKSDVTIYVLRRKSRFVFVHFRLLLIPRRKNCKERRLPVFVRYGLNADCNRRPDDFIYALGT